MYLKIGKYSLFEDNAYTCMLGNRRQLITCSSSVEPVGLTKFGAKVFSA